MLEGVFAEEIMRQQMPDLESRKQYGITGHPVEISRSGGKLQAWCNGFYVEGSGVRRLVHAAARNVLGQDSVSV